MGAVDFDTTGSGATVQDAFRGAVDDAQHEYGHGGYSGTIAEKSECVLIEVPDGVTVDQFMDDASHHDLPAERWTFYEELAARSAIEEAVDLYGDKWGPALAVATGPNEWRFFGLASS